MKRVTAGAAVIFFAATVVVASGALASGLGGGKSKKQAASITVLAGKPVEFAFDLSATALRPGPVVFKVTNKGKLQYSFQICSTGGTADSCVGAATPVLDPGATTTLTVNLKKGNHEFIGTAAGYVTMKGNVVADASAPATPQTTVPATTGTSPAVTSPKTTTTSPKSGTTTTPKTTTTTPKGGGSAPAPTTTTPPGGPTAALVGDPVAGAAVFSSAGCGGCHTLKAAGSTGTAGPNLDGVAPDQQTVITNVTFGNAMGMPAFANTLSSAQIQNVAAYVYKSTH